MKEDAMSVFTLMYRGNQIIGIHDRVQGDILVNVRDQSKYRFSSFVQVDDTEIVDMIASHANSITVPLAGGGSQEFRKPWGGLKFYSGGF